MTERSENNLTEILEAVARGDYERAAQGASNPEAWATWEDADRYGKHVSKQALLPVVLDVLAIVDAEPHKAKRGDEVDAFIKKNRDFWRDGEDPDGPFVAQVLDDMLDDYRAHADYGTPLSEAVHEPPTSVGSPSVLMHEYQHTPTQAGRYEAEAKYQFVDQTDVWAVHFNCPRASLQDTLERVSQLAGVTGEYLYEEAGTLSDHEAEPTDEDHRLVIYYRSTRVRAHTAGWHIVAHAHFAGKRPDLTDFYVSTAGDYAAQIQE